MLKSITTRENGSRRISLIPDTKSIVEQSHKKKVNINTIMARVRKGQSVPINEASPLMGDFTEVTSYHDAQNLIIAANKDFMSLSAEIRGRFDNDPGKLMAFMEDGDNFEEAIELGIVERPEPPEGPQEADPIPFGKEPPAAEKEGESP